MGQDVHTCSAVCFVASHLQAAVKTIPHLYVSEQNRPTPVWRWLSLTLASLTKLIPCNVGLAFLINIYSIEAFSCHSILHLYSAHRATLVPDWAGLFSSSSAEGTNDVLI